MTTECPHCGDSNPTHDRAICHRWAADIDAANVADCACRIDRMLAYDRALEYARLTGADYGKAAASWYFDGSTDDATYARVLQGIEDGDPEVLDTLPAPDLSGELADRLTGPELVRQACEFAYGQTGRYPHESDWFTDVCDAYESAYADAAQHEIARMARYQTDSDGAE